MTFEYDNKGKFFTDVIAKIPMDVLVQTTKHLIHGTIHIRRDERLKDELDRESNFLALTEASILGVDGKTLYQNDFIALRRRQIVWVIPDDDVENRGRLS